MYNAEDYRRKKRQVRKLRAALIIESAITLGIVIAYLIQII